ncbi:Mg-chelatase subunit ChlD [Chitinophaga sp. CF118]|uniref:vWA domain-containing protein n=1 Tax=Chitinophaga sp. CF118 TaxID=1884367 RepID=UPI0008EEB3A7|nr:VWA domain-containing protein [Chitinophaga sp. CF118]SFD48466.1 Mg-chelatase subunit ChlD [Chitinophaga sp. CF118]
MKYKAGKEEARKGLKISAHRGIKEQIKATKVDVLSTVKHYLLADKVDLKFRGNNTKADMQLLFLIDSSGSMVKDQQIACMKGLIQQTITHYKGKRLKYAAVALSNGEAQLLSPFTIDSDHMLHTIARLTSGGKTNMKAGFVLVNQLVNNNVRLYIFTDGQINAGGSFHEAVTYYKTYLRKIKETTVIDNESGFIQPGLSKKLATAIGAKYIQY